MKKYFFLLCVAAILLSLLERKFSIACALLLGLFIWVFVEDKRRRAGRFARGAGLRERGFPLEAPLLQMEFSSDGKFLMALDRAGQFLLWDARGDLRWRRPSESCLAFCPGLEGDAYLASADEFVYLDSSGSVAKRLPFEAAPYRQSYRLELSRDGKTLMLHTPWFLQFASAGLAALGSRPSADESGHYFKYCALEPDASQVFVAGAKLLDEEEGTEARWTSWLREAEAWKISWKQSTEHYGNSHLRGLWLDPGGEQLLLETYQQGYSLRLLARDGKELWRRPGGERACFGSQSALLLWDNPYEGLSLTDLKDRKKLWALKLPAPPRYKTLLSNGDAVLWQDDGWHRVRPDGSFLRGDPLRAFPQRFLASPRGNLLFMADDAYGAFVELLP